MLYTAITDMNCSLYFISLKREGRLFISVSLPHSSAKYLPLSTEREAFLLYLHYFVFLGENVFFHRRSLQAAFPVAKALRTDKMWKKWSSFLPCVAGVWKKRWSPVVRKDVQSTESRTFYLIKYGELECHADGKKEKCLYKLLVQYLVSNIVLSSVRRV